MADQNQDTQMSISTNDEQNQKCFEGILERSISEGSRRFSERWKNVSPDRKNYMVQMTLYELKDETLTETDFKDRLNVRLCVLLLIQRAEMVNLGELIGRIYEGCKQHNLVADCESEENDRRFLNIAHQIKETKLTHTFDFFRFAERVEEIFDCFYEKNNKNSKKEALYIAPYFVLVQSSGMGKTKLLFEYKNRIKQKMYGFKSGQGSEQATKELIFQEGKQTTMEIDVETNEQITAKLILCRKRQEGINGEKENEVFDEFIWPQSFVERGKTFNEIATDIFRYLDDALLKDVAVPRVVLLFDEAQYLLGSAPYKSKEEHKKEKEMDALLFRMIRLWISRDRQGVGPQIVAVFAGTTAKLQNFGVKDDLEKDFTADSRDYQKSLTNKFYERGKELFSPFCTTTTIGCLRQHPSKFEGDWTEYHQAIPYGRPLFAVMTQEQHSKGLATIVRRMVLDVSKWHTKEAAWLSILGTRVQMGQTSMEIASSLVSSAYANLISATQNSAHICFMPDPVCARLAMCMMDEEWSMELKSSPVIRGKGKAWWIEKVKDLYSRAQCSPEKGDFGEVMVALYFLFCADMIRQRKDPEYNTFSVPLNEWINALVGGGRSVALNTSSKVISITSTHGMSTKTNVENKKIKLCCEPSCICFGAIQVCRNYIRSYDDSWESLMDNGFLEYIYKSGIGFYVFPDCQTIDLVFSLRMKRDQEDFLYFPMFVSVKSHIYCSPSRAREECDKMVRKAEIGSNGKESHRALCVLVVFGSDAVTDDGDFSLSDSCVDELFGNNIVGRVLRVPMDDDFGLSQGYRNLTTSKCEISEIFASHSFLGAHLESSSPDSEKKKLSDGDIPRMLRTRPQTENDDALVWTKGLVTALHSIAMN